MQQYLLSSSDSSMMDSLRACFCLSSEIIVDSDPRSLDSRDDSWIEPDVPLLQCQMLHFKRTHMSELWSVIYGESYTATGFVNE
ncbi:unnamed protein product [Heligmosomoides polygyrus]|uniref:Ovule protein n=1 Tax=Heligmosomoides polygyrus TaxID=6339 RepID=A0A183FCR3_HELPZ|nr:unnamed protein product [Heligmosomoides polygyrus]